MPIQFKINETHRVVRSTWVGDIINSDLLPAYHRLFDQAEWQPGFNELVDLRKANLDGVTREGLELLISLMSRYHGDGATCRTAIITGDELSYGLSRMYEAMATDSPEAVTVFTSESNAREHLGIGPNIFD